MAISLVSLVNEFLTPTMIERIASALGIDRNKLTTKIAWSGTILASTACALNQVATIAAPTSALPASPKRSGA
jgi:hypothetical protein